MFRALSIIVILATLAGVALHFVLFGAKKTPPGGAGGSVRRYNLWERLVHLAVGLSFLTLALTGYFSIIRYGRLEGWSLWLHVVAAPGFAAGMACLALTWARAGRFAPHDAEWLRAGGGYFSRKKNAADAAAPPAGRFDAGQKIFFWAATLLTFVALGSMMLAMAPWFGTAGQKTLYKIHGYSTLPLVALAMVHMYVTLLAKRGAWRAMLSGKVGWNWAKRHHPLWRARVAEGKTTKEGTENHEA